jgi:16S rRNA (cytosine1402-N4)-methyltransferase
MRDAPHIPVLLDEVISFLQPGPGKQWLDGTVGLGGHAFRLLEASPESRLLGLDRDAQALEVSRQRLTGFGDRAVLRQGSFKDMKDLAQGFLPVGRPGFDGILMDLGVSSLQLDEPGRGFSFQADGPLDMRLDASAGSSAAQWLDQISEEELVRVLFQFGEEPQARRIARALLKARPLRSTLQAAEVVSQAVGGRRGKPRHPATRTFQAIRMAVNGELAALEAALPQAVDLLAPGGRLAVISFHSLEDRRVKEFFVRESTDCLCAPDIPVCVCGHKASLKRVTGKPVTASGEENGRNPRARSAKLRVAERS